MFHNKSEHVDKMSRLSDLKDQIKEAQKLNEHLLDVTNKQIASSCTFFRENQLEKYLTPTDRKELTSICDRHTY